MSSEAKARLLRLPGRPCETCRHPSRARIDVSLIAGESSRTIANIYGLSASSIKRHRAKCLPGSLVLARRAQRIADSEFLLARAAALDRKAIAIFNAACLTADHRSAIAAVSELRRLLTLQAAMATAQPNPIPSPASSAAPLEEVIVNALKNHPEARRDVAAALAQLERPSRTPSEPRPDDGRRRVKSA